MYPRAYLDWAPTAVASMWQYPVEMLEPERRNISWPTPMPFSCKSERVGRRGRRRGERIKERVIDGRKSESVR
jgi:hypothetical protein